MMATVPIESDVLPPAMLSAKRWLLYKLIQRPGKLKPDKVPFYASGKPRNGTLDTPEDIAHLVSFNDAIAASNGFSGIGFALGSDGSNVWQGIDFDDCDKFDAVGMLVKSGLPGYVERSVSGNGWHCIGYGRPFNTLGARGVGIEAYCKSRFFVVTGDCAGGDIEDLSDYVANELMPIYRRHSNASEAKGDPCDTQVITDLRNALNYLALDAESYHPWINVGLMLKTVIPEESGLGLWLDWSKLSDQFSRKECLEKWKSFNPVGVTYKSIFYKASQNGWANPGYAIDEGVPGDDEGWRQELISRPGKKVKVLSRLKNVVLFLENLPIYKGRFKFNAFSNTEEIDGRAMVDSDDTAITCALEQHIDEKISTKMVREAINLVARKSSYNPLTDYLSSVTWDGVIRVETLFIDYFGSDDTDYCRDVARSFMVSAVARAFVPGCKVDTMTILEGDQGLKKSTFIRRLVGNEWYAPMGTKIGDKDSFMALANKWVLDFGDLAGMSKHDANIVKAFLDHEIDYYRSTWGHRFGTVKRSCIFFGSTNEDNYLTDITGNRRFLPVRCPNTGDIDKLLLNRDQLWAEAVSLYKNKWPWWEVRDAKNEQDKRVVYDEWSNLFDDWVTNNESLFGVKPWELTPYNFIVSSDGLDMEKSRITNFTEKKVRDIFKKHGFFTTNGRDNSGKIRRFWKIKEKK